MSAFTRRSFFSVAAAAAAVPTAGARGELPWPRPEAAPTRGSDDRGDLAAIETLPNVCAHEHWGSLSSVGTAEGGFVADNVAGAASAETGLFDLLFDPYLSSFLASAGFDSSGLARQHGHLDIVSLAREQPELVLAEAAPHLANVRSAGALTCLTIGVRELYGFDLDALTTRNRHDLDRRLHRHYRNPFAWYREAMAEAHFVDLIRPVALSFMYEDASPEPAAEERAFTRPILRIDDFVQALPQPNSRVRYCLEKTGLEPHDAESWREFLGRVFTLAGERGNVGIKQLQAYSRDLDFGQGDEGAIDFAAADVAGRRPFEDFVVHECCRLAQEFGWPFQIHIGTANLPDSNPLPLQRLLRQYPRVRFVLIHGWPFVDEVAWLAHVFPNAYTDTCWLPVLSPSHLEHALRTYLGYVPAHKLMLSHDATSVEMAVGSARLTRRLLRKVLTEQISDGRLAPDHALHLARRALADNAREVYGLGPAR